MVDENKDQVVLSIKLPVSCYTLEAVLIGVSDRLDEDCDLMVDLFDNTLTIYREK